MEALCFEKTLEKSGNLLQEGEIVLMEGRLSIKDEKVPQLMANRIYSLKKGAIPLGRGAEETEKRQVRQPKKRLVVHLPSINDPRANKIRQYLVMFPGNDKIVVHCSDSDKRYSRACWVHPSLVAAVTKLVGDCNVDVQKID
jgi:DNA polymerase-3 subunit alpha